MEDCTIFRSKKRTGGHQIGDVKTAKTVEAIIKFAPAQTIPLRKSIIAARLKTMIAPAAIMPPIITFPPKEPCFVLQKFFAASIDWEKLGVCGDNDIVSSFLEVQFVGSAQPSDQPRTYGFRTHPRSSIEPWQFCLPSHLIPPSETISVD